MRGIVQATFPINSSGNEETARSCPRSVAWSNLPYCDQDMASVLGTQDVAEEKRLDALLTVEFTMLKFVHS